MVLMAYKQKKDARALELSPVYLSYIHYMQNADGTFRNFLSFSRNFLDEVWGEDVYVFPRTIDTHIANLRKKIGDDEAETKWIIGIRGIGYKFAGD